MPYFPVCLPTVDFQDPCEFISAQQQQMLMTARSVTTLAEKLPGLQGQNYQFISAAGANHNSGTGSYVLVNQQSTDTCDYLGNSLSSSGNSIDNVVPCSKITNSMVTSAKQHEPQRVTCVFTDGSTNGMNRDIDEDGTKLQRFYSSRNVTFQGLQLAKRFVCSVSVSNCVAS
uniref:DUF2235 domain-containing protein n=1 Tax=Elaeophora elaphi TaxID=1147741 RepID=A0A0R3S700_9BILA